MKEANQINRPSAGNATSEQETKNGAHTETGCGPKAASECYRSDDFFGQVSIDFLVHELKSPVSIIESAARLMLDKQGPRAPLTSHQQKVLERINRNAIKAREMLAQLLEVGRARDACFRNRPFKPVNSLKKIVIEVAEALGPDMCTQIDHQKEEQGKLTVLAQCGIRLEASTEMENVIVEQDEIKFSQVVGNLIQNGLYYRKRSLIVHATCRKGILSIAVRDDGPGISPVHHESIFERYKQVAPCEGIARNGHGLGLALARTLARSMGGDVGVESELGQGALFYLHLPFAPS